MGGGARREGSREELRTLSPGPACSREGVGSPLRLRVGRGVGSSWRAGLQVTFPLIDQWEPAAQLGPQEGKSRMREEPPGVAPGEQGHGASSTSRGEGVCGGPFGGTEHPISYPVPHSGATGPHVVAPPHLQVPGPPRLPTGVRSGWGVRSP